MAENLQGVRSYEISVWTLQDECITVLKPSELEFKGEVQGGTVTFTDDGTEQLKFSIPMYYYDKGVKTLNPAWQHILNGHFTANMHKVKLIFNKATEDEKVYEMLIIDVLQTHERDQIMYQITCEGLAFHELGKLGYKISLSSDTFAREFSKWFDDGQVGETPHATIQYWNDKIFKYKDGSYKYDWRYEVNMDWSGYSNGNLRDPHKVYEEEYISSYNVDPFEYTFSPALVEGYKEKWRQMDEEESNIYNLTQAIAEKFGVYCRYEYEHDVNYHIVGRKVVYYNSGIKESEGYADLTYPYTVAKVERHVDNTDTITKLFVRPIESDSSSSNLISITTVDGNPSKEDYLLNFDYLHDIHTITDEQYEQVHIYEGELREINEQAVVLEAEIALVEEELVKVRADQATYTNAIKLDTERMNNARLLYQQLTGDKEFISVTAANPDKPVLHQISNTSNGYYIDLKNIGILPETVNMYATINHSKHPDDGRLTDLITTGEMLFDEFNNLYRITNIFLPNNINAESQNILYVTYDYSPKTYYAKVESTWSKRLASDTANLALTEIDILSLESMLYSSDTDYCNADSTVTDAVSATTSKALVALRQLLNDVTVIDYDENKIDFEDRTQIMNQSTGSVRHRDNSIAYVGKAPIQLNSLVYGSGTKGHVIVTPTLPDQNTLSLAKAQEWATAYSNGTITLDTPITSVYKFSQIYIATCSNEDVTQQIIKAFRAYDNYYSQTVCSVVGNGIADASFAPASEKNSLTYIESKGYVDKALADEANGYCALYDYLLERKYNIITNFERQMGPALREGYWQADDYNDYGNKYSEIFILPQDTMRKTTINGETKPDLINFTWDVNNIFSGETDAYYEITVNQDKEYYLAVDLLPYTRELTNYTENLCFIYYDRNYLDLNREIKEKQKLYETFPNSNMANMSRTEIDKIVYYETYGTKTTAEANELVSLRNKLNTRMAANGLNENDFNDYKVAKANYNSYNAAIERNQNAALRWFVIDSQCEFAYVWMTDRNKNLIGYRPVLLLTGIKDLTINERLSIVAPYNDTWTDASGNIHNYEPFLGTINSEVKSLRDETGRQYSYVEVKTTHVSPEDQKLSYIKLTGRNETPYEKLSDNTIEQHTINYINTGYDQQGQTADARLVYPRIRINSLELKNNSDDVLISLNGYTLKYTEDFYVLMKLDADINSNEHKYFITLRPKSFIKYTYRDTPKIAINYTTSNASEAIYLDAIKVMKENAYPKVSYTVGLNVLNPNMIRTAYNKLRTIVHINDYELQLDKTTGYISSITLDLDQPQNDTVEIKNYETKFEDLFSTIVAQSESMRKNENTISIAAAAFSPSGTLYTSVLQDSLLKADLNYSFNQGKLTIDEVNGIWGTSSSGVVAFRGGGIFTASTKGPDGNWEWNTGILPTGINADLITSGQLDTNKIRIYSGDKIAFQMNGEGIFAYKTLASEQYINLSNDKYQAYMSDKVNEIDALQYVTYNQDGLFLIAEKDAKVLNDAKNDYITLQSNVKRVEISWDGLILRNWQGERTFYANPSTGDLHMSGEIETTSGHIGGWKINSDGLSSNYIQLVNSATNRENNGIFLTSTPAASLTITYNDAIYYAYKLANGSSDKIYYYNNKVTSGNYSVKSNDSILMYSEVAVACRPKWTKTVNETMEIVTGTSRDINGNEVVTKTTLNYSRTYVADSSNNIITYGGTGIVYDGSESLTSEWYNKLERTGRNLNQYVSYTTQTQLVNANLAAGTQIKLDTYNATFKVYAQDGRVEMNVGQLGSFTLNKTYLTGNNEAELRQTTLRQCSLASCTIDSYSYNYGLLIKNITGDSASGKINFERVNGQTGNFNVADMYFFKEKISAAQVIQPFSYQTTINGTNSTVKVTATTAVSNLNTYNTRTEVYGCGDIWNNGWSSVGISSIVITEQSGSDVKVKATASNNANQTTTLSAQTVYNNGYSAGHSDGYSEGYDKGYDDGYADRPDDPGGGGDTPGGKTVVSCVPNNEWTHTTTYSDGSTEVGSHDGYTCSQCGRSGNGGWNPPSGGGTCFIAGTLIKLSDNTSLPIEKLTIDTHLKAYDEYTEKFTDATIKSIAAFYNASFIATIHLESGETLTLTESHPVLTNHGWAAINLIQARKEHTNISISLLREDDMVYTINGWDKIVEIEKREDLDGSTVYNIDVEPTDTYIANNIIVHNADEKNN